MRSGVPAAAVAAWLWRIHGSPLFSSSAATSSKRGEWRGASTSTASPRAPRSAACAASAASSSPACVLPATHSGRVAPYLARSAWPLKRTAGAAARSNFRLPLTCTFSRGTPNDSKRSASLSDWAATVTELSMAGCRRARNLRQRAQERSDKRALAISTGTPARMH